MPPRRASDPLFLSMIPMIPMIPADPARLTSIMTAALAQTSGCLRTRNGVTGSGKAGLDRADWGPRERVGLFFFVS